MKIVLITSDGKYLYLASVVAEIGSGFEMAEVAASCWGALRVAPAELLLNVTVFMVCDFCVAPGEVYECAQVL